jgi:hypothetical protein
LAEREVNNGGYERLASTLAPPHRASLQKILQRYGSRVSPQSGTGARPTNVHLGEASLPMKKLAWISGYKLVREFPPFHNGGYNSWK